MSTSDYAQRDDEFECVQTLMMLFVEYAVDSFERGADNDAFDIDLYDYGIDCARYGDKSWKVVLERFTEPIEDQDSMRIQLLVMPGVERALFPDEYTVALSFVVPECAVERRRILAEIEAMGNDVCADDLALPVIDAEYWAGEPEEASSEESEHSTNMLMWRRMKDIIGRGLTELPDSTTTEDIFGDLGTI